ncbi:MAG: isochorismatase family protein [Acidimicrobiia bacterium]
MYDSKTALVVVDVQNDFADPGGSLFVAGGEEVVAAVNAEVIRAAAAGALVAYTQDWHPPRTPHFAQFGGLWPVHCVMGTEGAELHPRLIVAGTVLRKGSNGEDGYSGFTMRDPESGETAPTALHPMLTSSGVERLVVVGLAQDVCVKETACEAAGLRYQVTVLEYATAAVNLQPGDDERAARAMRNAGVEVVGRR